MAPDPRMIRNEMAKAVHVPSPNSSETIIGVSIVRLKIITR
jgi:hypothetical protein